MRLATVAFMAMLLLTSALGAKIPDELRQEFLQEQKSLEQAQKRLDYFQAIAERKAEIKKLVAAGKTEQLRNEFLDDAQDLDEALDDKDAKIANKEYNRLRYIYGKNRWLQDYFLYYQARKTALAQQHDKLAVQAANYDILVTEYPTSDKYVESVFRLEEIYMQQTMYDQDANYRYMELYEKYGESIDAEQAGDYKEWLSRQRYWLGQVNYNLGLLEEAQSIFTGMLEEAQSIFTGMLEDRWYGMRSDLMLALITTSTQGTQSAIDAYLALEDKYSKSDDHYDFIILSLARLYADDMQYDTSAKTYEQYVDLHDGKISNGIRYELAELYKNSGNTEQAEQYLNLIINNPESNQYYAPAKYLLATIEQERGNLDLAQQYINEAISKNQEVIDLLTRKYDLIAQSQKLVKDYDRELTQTEAAEFDKKMAEVKLQLDNTNNEIGKLMTGLDPEQITELQTLEREFFAKNEQIEKTLDRIRELRTTQNSGIPKMIDQQIEDLDLDLTVVQAYRYMAGVDEPMRDDYVIAFSIAGDIYRDTKLKEKWQKIAELAQEKGRTDIAQRAAQTTAMLEENIDLLHNLALQKFGQPADSSEVEVFLLTEADAIRKEQQRLRQMKTEVVADYNNQLAAQEDKAKKELVTQADDLSAKYQQSMQEVIRAALQQNVQYQSTSLDVLFEETKKMDEEWERERQRNAEQEGQAPTENE